MPTKDDTATHIILKPNRNTRATFAPFDLTRLDYAFSQLDEATETERVKQEPRDGRGDLIKQEEDGEEEKFIKEEPADD